MKTLAELREAMKAALKRWDDALTAFETATDETRVERAGDLATAESDHASAKAAFEQRSAFEQAKRDLPVAPVTPDEPSAEARVKSEPLTYHARSENSFFRDQYRALKGDMKAQERLQQHMVEMATEGIVADAEARALNETASTGGELVAPLYLQGEFLMLARAGRAYADALSKMALPPDVNTINIPRLVTGTTTATQVDLGAVSSTDITTGNLSFPVITVAGQQDLARQLYDRSFPGVDQILFADLAADYATKVDVQAINGSGTGGNAKGVLQVSGTNVSTYTTASPTAAGVFSKIADLVQQIHTTRFLPPSLITMHPRRWGWFLAQADSSSRPLVVPNANAFNPLAIADGTVSQGHVGTLLGLPVIVDPSIPITLGAGTNEDRILVQRIEDSWLLEDEPVKTRVFEEVLSNTLSIRVQLFNYLALTHDRYPKSIGVLSGTGLATPTF